MPEIVSPKTFFDEVEEAIVENEKEDISSNTMAQLLKSDINFKVILASLLSWSSLFKFKFFYLHGGGD